MAQVPHAVNHPAQILRDAAADVQVDHHIDQQPPPAPALNTVSFFSFGFVFLLWSSFQFYPVVLVPVSMSFQLLLFSLFYSFLFLSSFLSDQFFMEIFRVGHVDPLCMFKGNIRVGDVDPLCMFNENYSELDMWILYLCLMKIFRVGHVCMFNKIFRVGHVDPL